MKLINLTIYSAAAQSLFSLFWLQGFGMIPNSKSLQQQFSLTHSSPTNAKIKRNPNSQVERKKELGGANWFSVSNQFPRKLRVNE